MNYILYISVEIKTIGKTHGTYKKINEYTFAHGLRGPTAELNKSSVSRCAVAQYVCCRYQFYEIRWN